MSLGDRFDLGDQRRYLPPSDAGELDGIGKRCVELSACDAKPRVRSQTIKQVIVTAAVLTHLQGNRNGVLLDRIMCGLSTSAVPYRRDQHLGRREKWKVALQFGVDDSWERTEIFQHLEEGLEQPIEGEECVWQR